METYCLTNTGNSSVKPGDRCEGTWATQMFFWGEWPAGVAWVRVWEATGWEEVSGLGEASLGTEDSGPAFISIPI